MANISITRNENHCLIQLKGDLTATGLPDIQDAFKKGLDEDTPLLIVDLADIDMIDSSAIGLLIATSNTISKKGGSLQVKNLSEENFHLFESMRIAKRLHATQLMTSEEEHG